MAEPIQIKIPDIGGATGVEVIEILVKPGQRIEKEASLITLESDKASMEIPSPQAGEVKDITVKLGDKVSEGDLILTLNLEGKTSSSEKKESTTVPSEKDEDPQSKKADKDKEKAESEKTSAQEEKSPEKDKAEDALVKDDLKEKESNLKTAQDSQAHKAEEKDSGGLLHASPAVRRMARELNLPLDEIAGTGRKSRVLKEDLARYIQVLKAKGAGLSTTFSVPGSFDFSAFGPVERKPLNKIKRLTAAAVYQAWQAIPQVTQFDEADITDLEAFRKEQAPKSKDLKLTLLAFVTKVVAKALAVFPQFNASLDTSGETLIYKNYFNIGIAVETPAGLVVPVIKNADTLSVMELAKAMAALSQKAREKGLSPADMQGGCFTISSLGGIGGTAFTPIVKSPEVAILGLSRAFMKPIYNEKEACFEPRLMLPLSLSYDHRVIDGAEAARFTRYLSEGLNDLRRILL